jgi:hypothetical protein
MEWVGWYNNRRLHSRLDYIPPDEYEAAYYAQHPGVPVGGASTTKPTSTPRTVQVECNARGELTR